MATSEGFWVATGEERLRPDKRFQFVELTSEKEDWLERSCASAPSCDVLIISGHFGGTFFGNTGLELALSKLETLSCSETCDRVLKDPKEVWLFGCNTLAEKNVDRRTPEQYLNVLTADGIPRDLAERVVASRYTPLGASNKERMQKVFASVPRIYGFSSIAPSGDTCEPLLEKYLKKEKDYFRRLNKLETAKISGSLAQIQNASRDPLLYPNFNNTCITQCSGVDVKDASMGQLCHVKDRRRPMASRMKALNELLESDKKFSYLFLAADLMSEIRKNSKVDTAVKEQMSRLRANAKLWSDIDLVLKKSPYLGLCLDVASIKMAVGDSGSSKYFLDILNKVSNKGLGWEDADILCSKREIVQAMLAKTGAKLPQGFFFHRQRGASFDVF